MTPLGLMKSVEELFNEGARALMAGFTEPDSAKRETGSAYLIRTIVEPGGETHTVVDSLWNFVPGTDAEGNPHYVPEVHEESGHSQGTPLSSLDDGDLMRLAFENNGVPVVIPDTSAPPEGITVRNKREQEIPRAVVLVPRPLNGFTLVLKFVKNVLISEEEILSTFENAAHLALSRMEAGREGAAPHALQIGKTILHGPPEIPHSLLDAVRKMIKERKELSLIPSMTLVIRRGPVRLVRGSLGASAMIMIPPPPLDPQPDLLRNYNRDITRSLQRAGGSFRTLLAGCAYENPGVMGRLCAFILNSTDFMDYGIPLPPPAQYKGHRPYRGRPTILASIYLAPGSPSGHVVKTLLQAVRTSDKVPPVFHRYEESKYYRGVVLEEIVDQDILRQAIEKQVPLFVADSSTDGRVHNQRDKEYPKSLAVVPFHFYGTPGAVILYSPVYRPFVEPGSAAAPAHDPALDEFVAAIRLTQKKIDDACREMMTIPPSLTAEGPLLISVEGVPLGFQDSCPDVLEEILGEVKRREGEIHSRGVLEVNIRFEGGQRPSSRHGGPDRAGGRSFPVFQMLFPWTADRGHGNSAQKLISAFLAS